MAIARAIIDPGFKCPALSDSEFLHEMVSRNNDHNFEVIVCEALVEFEESFTLVFADGQLPLPVVKTNPRKIIVMGNTGCLRSRVGNNTGCKEGEIAEPFASLAVAAAADNPDLIIHTGNYNFRGTPDHVLFTETNGGVTRQIEERTYAAGAGTRQDENCDQDKDSPYFSQMSPGSNTPDTWKAWREDFFAAAGPVISAAPWVVTRGTHELCSRGGAGWYYFLDSHSNLVPGSRQVSCPMLDEGASAQANALMLYPYVVDFESFGVAVFDSSNACSAFTNKHFTDLAEQQLNALGRIADDRERLWLLSHMPIWGITRYNEGRSSACTVGKEYACVNQTLQVAIRGALRGELPGAIDLVLSGNLHQFQSLTFGAERPPTVIVGNSGAALVDSGPVGLFPVPVDGMDARVLATRDTISTPQGLKSAHGYLAIELSADSAWSGVLVNPAEGITIAECGSLLEAEGSVCRLVTGNDAQASGKIAPTSIISEPLQ
jgi:hypothetical protein